MSEDHLLLEDEDVPAIECPARVPRLSKTRRVAQGPCDCEGRPLRVGMYVWYMTPEPKLATRQRGPWVVEAVHPTTCEIKGCATDVRVTAPHRALVGLHIMVAEEFALVEARLAELEHDLADRKRFREQLDAKWKAEAAVAPFKDCFGLRLIVGHHVYYKGYDKEVDLYPAPWVIKSIDNTTKSCEISGPLLPGIEPGTVINVPGSSIQYIGALVGNEIRGFANALFKLQDMDKRHLAELEAIKAKMATEPV